MGVSIVLEKKTSRWFAHLAILAVLHPAPNSNKNPIPSLAAVAAWNDAHLRIMQTETQQCDPPTPARDDAIQAHPAGSGVPTESDRQVANRSRWQAMLLEAGGIGAALSDESMKRLKYCLQWLQVSIQ